MSKKKKSQAYETLKMSASQHFGKMSADVRRIRVILTTTLQLQGLSANFTLKFSTFLCVLVIFFALPLHRSEELGSKLRLNFGFTKQVASLAFYCFKSRMIQMFPSESQGHSGSTEIKLESSFCWITDLSQTFLAASHF